MTNERTASEALEGPDTKIPPLHFGPLRRWFESHPELEGGGMLWKREPA